MVFPASQLPGSMSHWLFDLLTLTLQWHLSPGRRENATFSPWVAARPLGVNGLKRKKKKNTVESGGEGETQERAWLDFSSRQTLLQSDRTPARYWFQNSHHHKCNASPQAVIIPHISLAWFQGLFPPNDLVSLCIMATIIFFSYKCIYFPSNTLRYWLSRSTRTMGRK